MTQRGAHRVAQPTPASRYLARIEQRDDHESAAELTIVLSTLGNYDGLRRVLDGYDRQDAPPGSFEVIVVSDIAEQEPESVDAAIGQRSFPVRRITPQTPGLSANRNAGRRAARSPLVMFTDNDTIPVPALVSEHLRTHREHPDPTDAVVGLVVWSPEVEITTFMRWLDTGLQFNFTNLEPGEVHWGAFAGANVSLKREFVERIGDFDEIRLPYLGEDTEFSYRASKLRMRLHYNERAKVDHLRTMSFEMSTRRVRRMAAAEYEITQMHPELSPWWHDIFERVSTLPPGNGRGVKLARWVPMSTPWLGPKVWRSVDRHYKQALAPHFLEAWDAIVAGGDADQPELAELLAGGESRSSSDSGREPSGPK